MPTKRKYHSAALAKISSMLVLYRRRHNARKQRYGAIAGLDDMVMLRLLDEGTKNLARLRVTMNWLEKTERETIKTIHEKAKDKMASRGAPQSTVR